MHLLNRNHFKRLSNITNLGSHWVHFPNSRQCTVTFDSNFVILKIWNCFQMEPNIYFSWMRRVFALRILFCFCFVLFCFVFVCLFCFVLFCFVFEERILSNTSQFYGKKAKVLRGIWKSVLNCIKSPHSKFIVTFELKLRSKWQ